MSLVAKDEVELHTNTDDILLDNSLLLCVRDCKGDSKKNCEEGNKRDCEGDSEGDSKTDCEGDNEEAFVRDRE